MEPLHGSDFSLQASVSDSDLPSRSPTFFSISQIKECLTLVIFLAFSEPKPQHF